jgi:alcohol dehydrogenase class IV
MHHGLANGIMIPYAMAFNRDAVPERLYDLAVAAGGSPANAEGFLTWLGELRAAIGIPPTLAAAGVDRKHIDRLVEIAVADGCHPNNPKPVTAADFRDIFGRAFGAA